jgi:hypothetical protein
MLNTSSESYNNSQHKVTYKMGQKLNKILDITGYESLKEQNKRTVRFSNGLGDLGPVLVLDDKLTRKEEETANHILKNPFYVDINETNRRYNVQDTEIEKLDDLLENYKDL